MAKEMDQRKGDVSDRSKYLLYESEKKSIQALNLPHDEYERMIMELTERLKI